MDRLFRLRPRSTSYNFIKLTNEKNWFILIFIHKTASRCEYIFISRSMCLSILQGYGVYKYENSFFRYEGEWKEGKKHGM